MTAHETPPSPQPTEQSSQLRTAQPTEQPTQEPAILNGQAALPADRLVDLVRWDRWYRSAHGTARMRSWATRHPALSGWHQPEADRAGAFQAPLSSPETDAMQAALVSLTQAGDADAAVALLVQLRPGLARLVRQLTMTRAWPRPDAVEEVRSVFFEVLVSHRLDRRPSRIAANLVLDTRQRLHRGLRHTTGPRHPLPESLPIGASADVDADTPILAYETLQAVAGTLPGSAASQRLTADLGFRAWVLGQPRSDIARELEIGPGTVRSRLHRFRAAIRSDYDLQFEYGRSA